MQIKMLFWWNLIQFSHLCQIMKRRAGVCSRGGCTSLLLFPEQCEHIKSEGTSAKKIHIVDHPQSLYYLFLRNLRNLTAKLDWLEYCSVYVSSLNTFVKWPNSLFLLFFLAGHLKEGFMKHAMRQKWRRKIGHSVNLHELRAVAMR